MHAGLSALISGTIPSIFFIKRTDWKEKCLSFQSAPKSLRYGLFCIERKHISGVGRSYAVDDGLAVHEK